MDITINKLMIIERVLLEVDAKYKFDITFGSAYALHKYLKEIGSITSYFFLIQDELFKKCNDTEKVSSYHFSNENCKIEYDITNVIAFIKEMISCLPNDFNDLVVKVFEKEKMSDLLK